MLLKQALRTIIRLREEGIALDVIQSESLPTGRCDLAITLNHTIVPAQDK